MADDDHKSPSARVSQIVPMGLGLSWLDVLVEVWKAGRKVLRGLADEGMYEVLEYESTLELQDRCGERAQFRKREKVRYLQNNIIAFQDQAWGDGEILLNYRCTPGIPVDRYRPGQKTHILISLREVKQRGDVDEFHIEWGIRKGFSRSTEAWETAVSHRMRQLKTQVVFPRNRPPLRTLLIESTHQKTHMLGEDGLRPLPDGRWLVSWETTQPRLHERYLLKWDW